MADETTPATLATIIPEFWRAKILRALYSSPDVMNHMSNVTGELTGDGDTLNLNTMPVLTVNTVGADGSLTKQAITTLEAELKVDQEKEVTILLTKRAKRQSMDADFIASLAEGSGMALKEDIEAAVHGLHSDVVTNTTVAVASLTATQYITAIQKLLQQKLPILKRPEEFCFTTHSEQYAIVKLIAEFTQQQFAGPAAQGAQTGVRMPHILDIPAYFTNEVKSSGGVKKNMLFHRDAFAWGTQSNFDFESADGLAGLVAGRIYSTQILYGVKTRREKRATLIPSTDV